MDATPVDIALRRWIQIGQHTPHPLPLDDGMIEGHGKVVKAKFVGDAPTDPKARGGDERRLRYAPLRFFEEVRHLVVRHDQQVEEDRHDQRG